MSLRHFHPLTRVVLFMGVGLYAALCGQIHVQALLAAALLVIVVACGVIRSHWRLLVWVHLIGLPGATIIFVAAGYERCSDWQGAFSWGLIEAAEYALRLEGLFLANLALIGTTSMRELAELFTHRWVPGPLGIPLLTAVRFIPLTLSEARRIYTVQRCRGLRLRPWRPRTWLPMFVPLLVSQMQRAHDMALMLVVRRMAPSGATAPPRRLRICDYAALGMVAALCALARL